MMSVGRLTIFLAAAVAILPASAFTAVSDAAKTNFQKYRSAIPSDLNVVAAGGWNNLVKLSADPKEELVSLIVSNLKGSGGKVNSNEAGKIDALAALLQSRGKGFDSDLIDGEWAAVLSRQGKKSPKFQKLVNKSDHVKKAFSNFNVEDMTFDNTNFTPHERGQLKAKVKYNPVADNFDVASDGSIVVRRIGCDIVGASFKYWKLPRLPLPLRRKGGYLDVLYLDEDIRVTKGNRGGLFVHFRPEFLEKAMSG